MVQLCNNGEEGRLLSLATDDVQRRQGVRGFPAASGELQPVDDGAFTNTDRRRHARFPEKLSASVSLSLCLSVRPLCPSRPVSVFLSPLLFSSLLSSSPFFSLLPSLASFDPPRNAGKLQTCFLKPSAATLPGAIFAQENRLMLKMIPFVNGDASLHSV